MNEVKILSLKTVFLTTKSPHKTMFVKLVVHYMKGK